MKSRMLISMLVIALVAAVIGGGTMAIFTDNAELGEAEFVAGTVKVSADGGVKVPNWNPGDEDEFEFCIENEGSKDAYVRTCWEASWYPGPLRTLVVFYKDQVQLVGVEWDSWCTECSGTEGPIATGNVSVLGDATDWDKGYYFRLTFNGLDDTTFIQNTTYDGWCIDNRVPITPGNYSGVEIYDPFCNPNWYDEVTTDLDLQARWEAIDFAAVSYIMNRDYRARGYEAAAIQQAMWYFTNSLTPYQPLAALNLGVGYEFYPEIVLYVGDGSYGFGEGEGNLAAALATTDNVKVDVLSGGWWEDVATGCWYYTETLEPDVRVCMDVKVTLDLMATDNKFQGMEYRITTWVEAIQASNDAAEEIEDWKWWPDM